MTATVTIIVAIVAVVAASVPAIRVHGLAGRVRQREKAREVERRHREALTGQVERLEDHAAGVPPEAEGEVVGVVVKKLGPRFPQ